MARSPQQTALILAAIIGPVLVAACLTPARKAIPTRDETAIRSETRLPKGFISATGTTVEPYTNTGWAKEIVHEKTGIEMVFIPAGTFRMGSPATEANRFPDEGPVHTIFITNPFYVGKYEVTQGQWLAVMGKNPSHFKGSDRLPMDSVSWDDSQQFLKTLGDAFRLPTEAEWEYACRAGARGASLRPQTEGLGATGHAVPLYARRHSFSRAGEAGRTEQRRRPRRRSAAAGTEPDRVGAGTAFSFGDNYDDLVRFAWYYKVGPAATESHDVGSKLPNPWGLYDVHGNMMEWCRDWYARDYYGKSPLDDPPGPITGQARVLRGGSWDLDDRSARSAARGSAAPWFRYGDIGLRVVLALSESPTRPTLTIPPVTIAIASDQPRIVLEAEAGKVIPPMETYDDLEASGGKYVMTPEPDQIHNETKGGETEFTVTIPAKGKYNVWLRVRWASGCDNSLWARMGSFSAPCITNNTYEVWQWIEMSSEPIELDAGPLPLRIGSREDRSKLDQILITTDLNYVPQERE